MLYSTVFAAASAFAGFASAQIQNGTFNTPIPCCTVPASSVPQSQRSDWCSAQTNTCVDLCNGQGNIASNGNQCDGTTLQHTCKCSNGTTLGDDVLRNYEQTIPGQMCRFWFGACINATGENSAQQFQCESARNSQCGNLTTKAFGSKSSGASGSGSPSRTSGGSSGSSPTSAGGSTASSGAAGAISQYGTSVFAGGLLALFGMAL